MGANRLDTLLSINPRLAVVLGIVTTVAAQVLLKRAGVAPLFRPNWFLLIVLSLGSYALSFVSYYIALRSFDISTIQPIMMASIVALVSLYGILSGEKFTVFKITGIVLAASSVFLMSR